MPSEQESTSVNRADLRIQTFKSVQRRRLRLRDFKHEHFRPLSGVSIAHGLSGLGKLNYQEATRASTDRRCSIGLNPTISVVTMSNLLMVLDQGLEKRLEE